MFFFFSSRRRHTRCGRDWSSDVCSSDLWWLALIAIVVPIPAFIANSHYGWRGYQLMRRQSPERRQMLYFNMVMTVDNFNKEIKLFNLGDFFINQYPRLAHKIYEENKGNLVRR